MTIYFASLRLCVKLGSQRRRDAKIKKDHICEKHSTTNLFCEMVLVTDSHIKNIRNEMTKSEIDHLFAFIFVFIIVIFEMYNQKYFRAVKLSTCFNCL